jgi:chromosome segregation ATPase
MADNLSEEQKVALQAIRDLQSKISDIPPSVVGAANHTTSLNGEIDTIAQAFNNTLLQVEHLKQELVKKNDVIRDKEVRISRLVEQLRFSNDRHYDIRAYGQR